MTNKIWNKIKQGFKWIANKIKGFWKWIAIGVVSASTLGFVAIQPDSFPSVIAEGQLIEFPYTDENSNEDFIIYTTSKEIYVPMFAWTGFDTYWAIVDKSGKNLQNIVFNLFSEEGVNVEGIYLLDEEATSIIKQPKSIKTRCPRNSTSTICHKEIEERLSVLGKWNEMNVNDFNEMDYNNIVAEKNISVKSKAQRKGRKGVQMISSDDKIYYLKVVLSVDKAGTKEVDGEVIGDKGSYGLLDPTIFTDDFEGYNVATLNGQGDWTTDEDFEVQSSVVFEGGKAVLSDAGGDFFARKSGTSTYSGSNVIYWRIGQTDKVMEVSYKEGAGYPCRYRFYSDGTFDIISSGASWNNVFSYSADTWYGIMINWDGDDDDYTLDVITDATTTSYGPYSAWNTWSTGWDSLEINPQDSGFQVYFDYIDGQEYATGAPAVVPAEIKMKGSPIFFNL